MKKLFTFIYSTPLLLLLCGFFWSRPTWQEINDAIGKGYPTVPTMEIDELKTALAQGQQVVLIDVRDQQEFAVSHLENAINITVATSVHLPKDTPIVAYCSVGVRSAAFAAKLGKAGYDKAKNLRGSIFAWANHGYPLVRGTTPVRVVHPFDAKWGALLDRNLHATPADLKAAGAKSN